MRKGLYYLILTSILLLNGVCFGQSVNTNAGTNFWFGFTETTDGVSADYVVYITTLKPTTGTVSIPGFAWSTNFTATPGITTRIVVPSADVVVSSFSGPVNQAVNVVSNSNVSVFAAIEFSERTDNTCIYPVSSLGNQYYIMDYSLCQSFSNFMIIAQGCKDSVQIIPSQNITVGGNHPANVPYTEVLQPGQVLLVQSNSDLTGSMVRSLNHAETGVIAGANWNCVFCSGTANPFYEELTPINTWGQNYVFVPTPQAQDQCRVLSEQNGTIVTFSTGGGPNTVTLNAGQYYDTTVNYASPVFINGTSPIEVGRFLRTGGCNNYYINNPTGKGDPSQINMESNEQMLLDTISFYFSRTPDIDSSYVQVVTRTADRNTVFLDNANIGAYFNVLGPNPTYAYAALTLLPGAHTLTTTGHGFVAYMCGLGFEDACAATDGIYLKEINIATVHTNPSSCGASDGSATANATGIPPFKYLWSNGQTNQTATGLSAGIYTVTVSDSDCVQHKDTAMVSISGRNGYSATVTDTNPNCNNPKGKSTVNPVGGTPPYTYSWNNGQTNQTATGLSAGSYTCTITDNTGCKYFITTTIAAYTAPAIGISPYTDSLCGAGSVPLHVYGLNTNVYNWSPNGSLSCNPCATPTATPTVTTTYTISGVDSSGCAASATLTITILNVPKPIVSGRDSICLGSKDTLSVTGGVTYSWSNGATTSSIIVNPAITKTYTVTAANGYCASHDTTFTIHVVSPPAVSISASKDTVCAGDSTLLSSTGGGTYKWLVAGNPNTSSIWVKPGSNTTYSVVIKNVCGLDTLSKAIFTHALPIVTKSNDTTICFGQGVTLSASGGNSYTWSPGGTGSSINVVPSTTTTYTVKVSNGTCASSASVTVTVIPKVVIGLTHPFTLCVGDSTPLSATGGGTYKWSTGATTSSIMVKPTKNTTYTVVVSNGCPDSATTTVTIDVPTLAACCDTTIFRGNSTTINAAGQTNYSWSPSSGLSCDNCPNPVASPTVTTTYTVTSNDPNGCPVERTITIYVETPCADFNVPDVFTPNNDGINDDFVINILNPSAYSINIYDRWGKEVYTSTDATVYWNGRILKTQYLVPDGVYYYVIKASCQSNNYIKKGFVQVLGGN